VGPYLISDEAQNASAPRIPRSIAEISSINRTIGIDQVLCIANKKQGPGIAARSPKSLRIIEHAAGE
jgi:hypothetical protein